VAYLLKKKEYVYSEVEPRLPLQWRFISWTSVSLFRVVWYLHVNCPHLRTSGDRGLRPYVLSSSYQTTRQHNTKPHYIYIYIYIYRVIHKTLRDFRPLRYSSRDGHAEGKHVNRGRHTPSFCPTLQVLDMCTLGDAADVNPVIKFLRQALPSRLLYRRGRKSRRNLWITLYIYKESFLEISGRGNIDREKGTAYRQDTYDFLNTFLTNIIRAIKTGRVRKLEHSVCLRKIIKTYQCCVWNLKERQ
jgi:glycosyltransferase involved in cell wall biosynthesis